MGLLEKLDEAIKNEEVLTIVYNGGSQPGAKRKITPLEIHPPYLDAYDHIINVRKTFRLDKIEIASHFTRARDYKDYSSDWKLPRDVPTQRQLDYAKDLGVKVPQNATREEVSDLISFASSNDTVPSDLDRQHAGLYGVQYTQYTGKEKLYENIFIELSAQGRERDLCAWFAYRVYRQIVQHKEQVPITSPDDPIIKEIASELATEPSALQSIRRYSGTGLLQFGSSTCLNCGSNRTISYKKAAAFIQDKLGIQVQKQPRTAKHDVSSSSTGCLLPIIAVGIISLYMFINH